MAKDAKDLNKYLLASYVSSFGNCLLSLLAHFTDGNFF